MPRFFRVFQVVFKSRLNLLLILALVFVLIILAQILKTELDQITKLTTQTASLIMQLSAVSDQYDNLKGQDQVKLNQSLLEEINNIHDIYQQSVKAYQDIVDLRDQKQDTKLLDQQFAQILSQLSDKNYASASTSLTNLTLKIKNANLTLSTSQIPQTSPAPINNTPPLGGYSQQQVQTDTGVFTVDIISADLNTTKVVVDTASTLDCSNNCPVLPLSAYISKNGAYAGINGAFFCPTTYPSCAGKTNSFDTLLMNKDKVYFNSSNNIYSTVPAVIFSQGSARFVSQSLQWGRDTSPDSVIANYPLLVSGNQIVYTGSNDPKFGGQGARCFVGNRGNIVYIGCVLNATMSDSAHVLKTLGMDNGLNLDEGGSTALWFAGYKLGPGRDLPNAVLFIKR